MSASLADWRPATGRHSIRDVVVHAAYWKYAVRRRLTGDKRGSFARAGSNWFVTAGSGAWAADVALLVDEHRKLRAAIAALDGTALDRRVRGRDTAAFTIRGIAAHDLYHAGQIQLLKALHRRPARRAA